MKTGFHSHFYANFHASVTLLFLFGFIMKFSPKCRTKKLGMIYIVNIFGSFCSFLSWEGANIQPQIRPRKIPDTVSMSLINKKRITILHSKYLLIWIFANLYGRIRSSTGILGASWALEIK